MATKTEKKIEKQIVAQLRALCDGPFQQIDGFCWVSHQIKFGKNRIQLVVLLAFRHQEALRAALAQQKAMLIMVNGAIGNIASGIECRLDFQLDTNVSD